MKPAVPRGRPPAGQGAAGNPAGSAIPGPAAATQGGTGNRGGPANTWRRRAAGPNAPTIQVGLSYMTGCFNDGGPSIGNRTDTPEQPYFRAVVADLEAKFCVDRSKLFLTGFSSGGWEAYTLGCAAADLLRGIGAD